MTVGGANPNGIGSVVPLWAASPTPPAPPVGFGFDGLGVHANEAVYSALAGLPALPDAEFRGTLAVVAYDDTEEQGVLFELAVPNDYAGGAFTLTLFWVSDAEAGDVVWDAQFERNEAGHNVDVPAFLAAQTATAPAAGTTGDIVATTIAFTQAQADGIVAGNLFRLLVTRDADEAADNLAGDAQLVGLTIT